MIVLGDLHLYQKHADNVMLTHRERYTAFNVATRVGRGPLLC